MAAGDLKNVEITGAGWNALITVEGVAGGGTYDFGLGSENQPTNARLVFNLTSPGFDSSGNATTVNRTVYGVPCVRPTATGAMRKVYPNQASPDETVSGSDVIIRVALSDFVYVGDTSVTLTATAGWYTVGGVPSNATTAQAVTNNSTEAYPLPIGGWLTPQCQTIQGTNIHVEFLPASRFASNGKQVACVKFDVTDGTTTISQTVSAMTVSADSPLGKIVCYQADFSGTTLLDLTACNVRARAYPIIGAAAFDTADGAFTFPTPQYCNLQFTLDKTLKHGYVVVDQVNGNDTTGTVYATQAAAEAGSACLTFGSAYTKLQAYHNANCGHNDAGGGTILIPAGTSTHASTTNGGTLTRWVTITRMSTATKENAILTLSATSNIPTRLRIHDLTFNSAYYFNGQNAGKAVGIDSCILDITAAYPAYQHAYAYIRNCTGNPSVALQQFGLIRGTTSTVDTSAAAFVMAGNLDICPDYYPAAASTQIYNDGLVCAYNEFGARTITPAVRFGLDRDVVRGAAYIQNLMLRYNSSTQNMCALASDGNTVSTNQIILHNNSIVGQRSNLGYNDTDIAPHYHKNWSIKNNILTFNNKDDTFFPSANGVGAWMVGYNVGSSGNHFVRPSDNEWKGEFQGLYMVSGDYGVPLAPGFVEDNSLDGNNTSGGDYHLTASSPCKALVPAGSVTMPYDFEGNARTTTNADAPGVYRYYTAPVVTGGQTWKTTGTAWAAGRWLSSIWS